MYTSDASLPLIRQAAWQDSTSLITKQTKRKKRNRSQLGNGTQLTAAGSLCKSGATLNRIVAADLRGESTSMCVVLPVFIPSALLITHTIQRMMGTTEGCRLYIRLTFFFFGTFPLSSLYFPPPLVHS